MRLFKNQRGDSFISVMIASALLGGAAIGGGAVVKLMKKETDFSHIGGTVIALESQIIQGLRAPATYDGGTAASLRAGSGAPNLRISMHKNSHSIPIASVAGPVTLDRKGEPCAGSSCALTTRLDIRCSGGTCRAAYQIATNAAIAGTALPLVGAQQWPPNFPNDYDTTISYDLYKRQDADNACAAGELFVSGMNRHTGRVRCVRNSTRRLASNQIAKTVEYDAVNNSVEFTGQNMVSATCPAKYRLQTVNPGAWESSAAGSSCVYRYKRRVDNWMTAWPTGMQSVSGQVCPSQDYRAVASGGCRFVETGRQSGYEAKSCPNPDGSTYDCSVEHPSVGYPVISQSISGPTVSCSYSKANTGPWGADFTGYVTWSGHCELAIDEIVPAGTGG